MGVESESVPVVTTRGRLGESGILEVGSEASAKFLKCAVGVGVTVSLEAYDDKVHAWVPASEPWGGLVMSSPDRGEGKDPNRVNIMPNKPRGAEGYKTGHPVLKRDGPFTMEADDRIWWCRNIFTVMQLPLSSPGERHPLS
jgi:hypothetical protein